MSFTTDLNCLCGTRHYLTNDPAATLLRSLPGAFLCEHFEEIRIGLFEKYGPEFGIPFVRRKQSLVHLLNLVTGSMGQRLGGTLELLKAVATEMNSAHLKGDECITVSLLNQNQAERNIEKSEGSENGAVCSTPLSGPNAHRKGKGGLGSLEASPGLRGV